MTEKFTPAEQGLFAYLERLHDLSAPCPQCGAPLSFATSATPSRGVLGSCASCETAWSVVDDENGHTLHQRFEPKSSPTHREKNSDGPITSLDVAEADRQGRYRAIDVAPLST